MCEEKHSACILTRETQTHHQSMHELVTKKYNNNCNPAHQITYIKKIIF